MNNINTECTAQPVCPHCGNVEHNDWELDFPSMDGTTTNCCGNCGKDYKVTRSVSVYYDTEKIKETV